MQQFYTGGLAAFTAVSATYTNLVNVVPIRRDEGILKRASRSVTMGLGVRVQKGDATGFAFVQELTFDAMKGAAETAARPASDGGHDKAVGGKSLRLAHRYDLQ